MCDDVVRFEAMAARIGDCCICGASIVLWDGVPRDRCRHCAAALREAGRRAAKLTDDEKRIIAKRAVEQLLKHGRVRLRLFPGAGVTRDPERAADHIVQTEVQK